MLLNFRLVENRDDLGTQGVSPKSGGGDVMFAYYTKFPFKRVCEGTLLDSFPRGASATNKKRTRGQTRVGEENL